MKCVVILLTLFDLKLKCVYSEIPGILGPCPRPKDFPASIGFTLEAYHNFDHRIEIPFVYVVSARNPEEVVTLSNWAYRNGYRIRAKGGSHVWAPLQFALTDSGVPCPKIILVDTTKHLNEKILNPNDYGRPDLNSVTVGSGLMLWQLLEFLEENGMGIYACPTIGPITLGGILAVGAHGSGIPSRFDKKSIGHSYGTLSNLVIDMTIVAWNEETFSYHLKTLYRWDKDCKAFLTSLGRTFITSVTLRVGLNQNLRSRGHFFIPYSEFFAHPDETTESTRTLASFTENYGRIQAYGLPFGKFLWITTWTAEDRKPLESKEVFRPYHHYILHLPSWIGSFIEPYLRRFLRNMPRVARMIYPMLYPVISAAETAFGSADFWGLSKNHLLSFPSFIPGFTPNGFAVVTSRVNLQLVVSIIQSHHARLSKELSEKNIYPYLIEFNIRVTGVDNPGDIEIPGAESPSFSPASMLPEYPEYDKVLWIESPGFPNTPGADDFITELQSILVKVIHGKFGILRAEWSKSWAFSNSGPWTNLTVIHQLLPRSFSTSEKLEEWNWAVKKLNAYDPHKIFSNDFLDDFLIVYNNVS